MSTIIFLKQELHTIRGSTFPILRVNGICELWVLVAYDVISGKKQHEGNGESHIVAETRKLLWQPWCHFHAVCDTQLWHLHSSSRNTGNLLNYLFI